MMVLPFILKLMSGVGSSKGAYDAVVHFVTSIAAWIS
jgi:hypothetical protein